MRRDDMADASDVLDAVLLEVIPLPKKPIAFGLSILIFSVIFFNKAFFFKVYLIHH